MTVLAIDRSEARALLNHTALCFTVAGGLGFIAAGLTGFELKAFVALSTLGQDALALVCVAACFAILWCSPDGPDRWRPFVVSSRFTEGTFGGAATIIALGGMAALAVSWFG